MGTNVFRLSDGTVVTNTALITRGFKAGYNIMQTAGGKDGNGGEVVMVLLEEVVVLKVVVVEEEVDIMMDLLLL